MKTMVKTILFAAIVSTMQVQAQTDDDALKIDSNGNVGINTSTPSEKLEVNGNVKATNVTATGNVNATNVTATGNVNATGKVKENGNDLLPKGTIVMWSGDKAPAGWAICNGEYNQTYGGNLPDLTDRFIVGAGQSYKLKDTGGLKEVTLTVEQMPSHNHQINVFNDVKVMYRESHGTTVAHANPGTTVYDRKGGEVYDLRNNISLNNTGGDKPHENRPPYYALYYIMKL